MSAHGWNIWNLKPTQQGDVAKKNGGIMGNQVGIQYKRGGPIAVWDSWPIETDDS